MRITNDCSPDALLAEMFHTRQMTREDTAIFRESLWSNHDEVCDEFKERVDALLQSYIRLGNEVHVTQSMRDNGVDIFLAFDQENGVQRRIGIQVKSNNEAIAATKRNRSGESMEAVLKRQAFESSRWNLSEWWIVLCFDLTKAEHRNLVKRINSELLQGSQTPIRIYEPTKAWSLLSMQEDEVDALCVLALCKEDEILVEARSEVDNLSRAALNVVMETLFESLVDPASQYSLDELIDLTCEDYTRDINQTSNVLNDLGQYLTRDNNYEDRWNTNPYIYKGICALYFEGRVRHQLSHPGAANFVRKLMFA